MEAIRAGDITEYDDAEIIEPIAPVQPEIENQREEER